MNEYIVGVDDDFIGNAFSFREFNERQRNLKNWHFIGILGEDAAPLVYDIGAGRIFLASSGVTSTTAGILKMSANLRN